MKRLIYFVFMFNMALTTFAQPDPDNEPGWFLISNLSDEFSGDVPIDANKWDYKQPWGDYNGTGKDYCLTDDPSYRYIGVSSGATDGYAAKLVFDNTPSTCTKWDGTSYTRNNTTGALFGKNDIKYGFFKIRCRMPNNGIGSHGIGAGLWMFQRHDMTSTHPDVTWSEIDFAEIDIAEQRHTCNIHYGHTTQANPKWFLRNSNEYDYFHDFSNWTEVSCLWTPNRIEFYIDDLLVRQYIGSFSSGLLPMQLIFKLASPAHGKSILPGITQFPITLEIDYVRVYQHLMDCNDVVDDCSFYFGGHNQQVKKSIRIGNGGCGNTQPLNTDLYLRASDFVELQGDFTVPLGAEMTAEVVGCY